MSNRAIKWIIITGSLLLLALSLTQDAIVRDYQGVEPQSSLAYFLGGSIAIIGGGAFEWFIWLANPLCLLSIIYLIKDSRIATVTAPVALVLAISYRFWKEELGAESGAMAKIVSFEAGYYLWILSIFILNAGIIYYFKYNDKITDTDNPDSL